MLVSVMLCTHVRRPCLIDAINCYLSQDYSEKELVVIDDGDCRDLFDVVPKNELVYFKDGYRQHNLATKRNIGVHISRGEAIVNMDSDDWSAPTRVSEQVAMLMSEKSVELVGYNIAHFWNEETGQASKYIGSRDYSWGPALCYKREYAICHPWPGHIEHAEDNQFVSHARKGKTLRTMDGSGKLVCRIATKDGKCSGTSNWPYVPVEELPIEFRKLIGKA